MLEIPFETAFGDRRLKGDRTAPECAAFVLHGAGQSSRTRFDRLRRVLDAGDLPTAAFDFVGHGETGGNLLGSSLSSRTEQAACVIRQVGTEPLTLIAASMSGYTAIRLTERFAVDHLVLLVPAVYVADAYHLPFGPAFSAAIRQPGSWRDSDAFGILSRFRGSLLIIAAESDHVIPPELVERLYASATNARTRLLHVVPGSGHLSLFPTEQDLLTARDRILEVCS